MGYAAVALLSATGAINTPLLVGNVDSPAGTPYGRLLSLKILLFSVMVVLALINRFRLLPRLRREPPTASRICQVSGNWRPPARRTVAAIIRAHPSFSILA